MSWTVACDGANGEEGYLELPIAIRQGDSKTLRVDLGSPVDGVVLRGSVRTGYQDDNTAADVLDFEVTPVVANQVFNCRVLPVDSAAASPGEYVYDIEYEVSADKVNRTFLGGPFVIKPQVTANA